MLGLKLLGLPTEHSKADKQTRGDLAVDLDQAFANSSRNDTLRDSSERSCPLSFFHLGGLRAVVQPVQHLKRILLLLFGRHELISVAK